MRSFKLQLIRDYAAYHTFTFAHWRDVCQCSESMMLTSEGVMDEIHKAYDEEIQARRDENAALKAENDRLRELAGELIDEFVSQCIDIGSFSCRMCALKGKEVIKARKWECNAPEHYRARLKTSDGICSRKEE